jgi:hypothetical protein
MKIIKRTPAEATKILEAEDDSTTTMKMCDSTCTSSFFTSTRHWKDSLGIHQADANQRSSSEDKPKKSVSFGDITIRDHPMIIGDSVPGCGVPLTIDWEAQSEVVLKVEDYEECRPERRRRRAMIMPPNIRASLAMNSGCTMREISRAVYECERIRKERASSLPSEKAWSRISKVMRTRLLFKKKVLPHRLVVGFECGQVSLA